MPHRLALGLHRTQRHLSGQSGRPPLRSADCGRRALRRSLVVVVDSGLFVEHSADEAGARGHRSERDRPQLSGGASASSPTRRCSSRNSRTRRYSRSATGKRFGAWHEAIEGWKREWEAFTKPNFDIERLAVTSRTRGERGAQRTTRRRHHLARQRRASQLVHAILGGAPRRKRCSTPGASRRWASA